MGAGADDALRRWLGTRGVAETDFESYERALALIRDGRDGPIAARDVDAAIRTYEAQGATPKQLANLKMVGDTLAEYFRNQAPSPASAKTDWRDYKVREEWCSCPPDSQNPYVDDGQTVMTGGGGIGVAAAVAIGYWTGLLGAITAAALVGALTLVGSAMSVRVTCAQCHHRVVLHDRDEQRTVNALRAKMYGGAAALLAVAIAAAGAWIWLIKSA